VPDQITPGSATSKIASKTRLRDHSRIAQRRNAFRPPVSLARSAAGSSSCLEGPLRLLPMPPRGSPATSTADCKALRTSSRAAWTAGGAPPLHEAVDTARQGRISAGGTGQDNWRACSEEILPRDEQQECRLLATGERSQRFRDCCLRWAHQTYRIRVC
jgi:hypothetical protein